MDQTVWSTTVFPFFPLVLDIDEVVGIAKLDHITVHMSCIARVFLKMLIFICNSEGLWQSHFELDYNPLTVIIEFWQMFKATGLHIKALSFVG